MDAVKVKKDQKINKGDVLAVYHVETSKTKLQKEKILVQQARANYESGLSNLQNALSQAENELMTVKKPRIESKIPIGETAPMMINPPIISRIPVRKFLNKSLKFVPTDEI